MSFGKLMRATAFALGMLSVGSIAGCGGVIEEPGGGPAVGADDGVNMSALRRTRWRRTSTATSTTTTAGTTATTAPASTADAIAAAQTPDGAAIPQPAGPNGVCPAVVQLLGFWSCVTIDEVCTYQWGGVSHRCVCTPVSGEGQYPSWLCDQ